MSETNQVAVAQPLSMTSREIAKLTSKEHRNVLADIRNMLESLELDVLKFQRIYTDPMNRAQTEYALDKELTVTLTAGYNIKQRHAIIKRWLTLEGPRPAMNPMEMVIASAQAILKVEREQAEQSHRLSSVESRLDRMSGDTGYMTVTAWCSARGVKLSLSEANLMGRRCSSYCKQHNITTGKVPDERFGSVKSYPVQVLDEQHVQQ